MIRSEISDISCKDQKSEFKCVNMKLSKVISD